MAGQIFSSYLRDDSQWIARRPADTLSACFGDDRVLLDIDGIGGGEDFGQRIHSTLEAADAVIVLIEANWLSATGAEGRGGLGHDVDWAVNAVATALDAGIPVFPVLIEEAVMPAADQLPQRLRKLARVNAVSIGGKRWDEDVERLAKIVSLDIPSARCDPPMFWSLLPFP